MGPHTINAELTRRSFLTTTALALAAIPAAPLLVSAKERFLNGPCRVATSSATFAAPTEPGERILVRGQIFQPDGVTPKPNAIVYAYHTDVTGVYNTERGAPPRLRGWMRTDKEGRYEFHSIKPGAYPNGRDPAHIHFQLWGTDFPPQWNNDIHLDGDPHLTEQAYRESAAMGRFGIIRKPVKDASGVWVFVHDIRMKPNGSRFEENIMHGLEACR